MVHDLLAALGRGSIEPLWIPLALWTVAAVLGLGALTGLRGLHPLRMYRLAQALLLALPLALLGGPVVRDLVPPAASAGWIERGATVWVGREAPVPLGVEGEVDPGAAASTVSSAGDPLGVALGLTLLAAAGWGLSHLVLLGRRIADVGRLERSLAPVTDGRALARLDDLALRLGVTRSVAFKAGPPGSVPMTWGWARPVVAIPPELLSDTTALEMALRHELIHIRRADYVWGIVESAIAAACAAHPVVRWLVGTIADARERSCDLEVAAGVDRPDAYGRLLVSMAGRDGAPLLVAAGFALPASKLKERLETMTRFIDTPHHRGRARTSVAMAAMLTLTLGVGAACAIGGPEVAIRTDADPTRHEPSAAELTSRFPAMSDETRAETVRRLDVQMAYLVERMDDLLVSVEDYQTRDERIPDYLTQQYDLLNNLYRERLETYETLKLEAETERRLAEM